MSKRQNPPNARFWVYECGSWCKLTLRPGQRLTLSRVREIQHEGWSREETCWRYAKDDEEGWTVTATYYSEGVDCDGPHEWLSHVSCPVDRLAARETQCAETDEVYYVPEWERVYATQRDRYAEAMGY